MDVKLRIAKLKEEKLARISNAAKDGLTQVVISESRNVEEIERLQKRIKEIEIALENIDKKTSPESSPILDSEAGEVSGKKRGRKKQTMKLLFYFAKTGRKNLNILFYPESSSMQTSIAFHEMKTIRSNSTYV